MNKRLESLEHNIQIGNALLDKNLKRKNRIIINPPQDFKITSKEKDKQKISEIKQYMIIEVEELEQKFLESTGEEYNEYKKVVRRIN